MVQQRLNRCSTLDYPDDRLVVLIADLIVLFPQLDAAHETCHVDGLEPQGF